LKDLTFAALLFDLIHGAGSFSCYWFLQNGARSPPVASEPLGYGQRHDATVDIPLDTTNVNGIANSETFS